MIGISTFLLAERGGFEPLKCVLSRIDVYKSVMLKSLKFQALEPSNPAITIHCENRRFRQKWRKNGARKEADHSASSLFQSLFTCSLIISVHLSLIVQ